jgi:hypothetical protein
VGCLRFCYQGTSGWHKKGEEYNEEVADDYALNQGEKGAKASIEPTNKEPFEEVMQEDSEQTEEDKYQEEEDNEADKREGLLQGDIRLKER